MAIREKLIGILILTAAIPVILGVLFLLWFGEHRYATEKGEGFYGKAHLVESGLRAGMYTVVAHIESWAAHDRLALRCGETRDHATWPEGLRGAVDGIEARWPNLAAESAELSWLFDNPLASSARRLQGGLPIIVEVLVTDAEGRLMAATGKSSDYYQADEDWWQRGFSLEREQILISEIGYDDSAQVASVDLVFPVYPDDPDARPVAVIKAVLDASPLIGRLTVNRDAGLHTQIVLNDGRVLADFGNPAFVPLTEKLGGPIIAALDGDEASFVENAEGRPRLYGHAMADWSVRMTGAYVLLSDEALHVLVSDDYERVMQPVRTQIKTFGVAAGLISVGFLVMGTLLAQRKIVRPLSQLRHAARDITLLPSDGLGREEGTVRRIIEDLQGIRSRDEVEDLARDFGNMAERVFAHEAEMLDRKINLQNQVDSMTTELRRSEELNRLVVETATDGIITINARGIVGSFNPGAEKIFGWSAGEVVGENIRMLMPAPYHDEHDGYLERYQATGERKIIGSGREVRGRRKDGTDFPMYLAVGEGLLEGAPMFTGIIRDITDLHRAREAMEKSNRELQLQNEIKSRLAALDDRLRGERDPERLGRELLRGLAVDLEFQAGAFYAREDEEQRFRRVGAYACSPNDVEVFRLGEGLVGQAAKSGKLMRLNEVPDGYLTIHSGLGAAAPGEVLILPITVEDEVNGVLELAAINSFTDGDLVFLQTVAPHIGINLEATRSHRQLSALLEQTRSQAEALEASREDLQQANDDLQEQKLTVELAKERIERQAEAVQQASRYKSEFLANMSHELRTPLNSLLILAKMLGDNKPGNLSPKQVTFAQTIHRSGSDLLDLINDILDLSKVEAGRLEFHLEPASIDGLLADLRRQFQHVADEKHLSLDLQRAEELPDLIQTDAKRLQQILKNLLSNAFKFTREGGIKIQVRRPLARELAAGMDAKAMVAFSVSDSGIGIPADKQQAIFEAFQQADGSTSRNYGGTGLGLSIAREFSQRLGGRVHVESEPGKGSVFTLVVEAEAVEAAPPARSGKETVAPPPVRPGRERPLVLVVEDDLDFAGILAELARERGFDYVHGSDGQAGIELARKHLPDAILLDIQMPVMSGIMVKEELERDPETRDIPVHFMSVMEPTAEVRRLGYAGYLTKPVAADDLQELFGRIGGDRETPRRILVVEDDTVQQQALQAELEEHGVACDLTPSAQGARDLLQKQRYDAIILDLGLEGGESGFDLLESLADIEGLVIPPVVVYTAMDLEGQHLDRLRAFTDRIVNKHGSDRGELLDTIGDFLGRFQTSGPVEPEPEPEPGPEPNAEPKPTPAAPAREPAPAAPAAESGPEGVAGLKVLLVDDDIRNVFALSAILEEGGMDVTVAQHGGQALEALEANPGYDIVLMDIMMPEMDGYEATRRIREQERFAQLPVIALTAKAMKGDREACLEAGANEYLSKPVDTEKLLGLIKQLAGPG